MAANPLHLMTVEEFRLLERPAGDHDYELHSGQPVQVPRPKLKHYLLQTYLCGLLSAMAPSGSFVGYEFAFRAFAEYDLRVADVAYVSAERWAKIDPEDNLLGAPDLAIEILSLSNTAREMYEKEYLCLTYGARQFWVIDSDKRSIRVASVDDATRVYGPGESIGLGLFPGELRVDAIL